MIRKLVLLAAILAGSTVAAQPAPQAPARPAADPSALYGARENIEGLDISPDGNHVVYLQPGPGRITIVYVYDLAGGGAPRVVIRSDGNPERLRWCSFVTNERLICQVSLMTEGPGMLVPFSRLISIDTSGQNLTMLGQHSSLYDARLRQYDGAIIDWGGGQDGTILMTRDYVPEEGRIGSNISRRADGLAVDRIDVRTLRSTRVEPPNRRVDAYLSDGRGNVRIMSTPTVRGGMTGQLGSRTDYFYRTDASRDWRPFGNYDSASGEGMIPLAVDPALNAAYVLKKSNGRFALYRVKLDGSLAVELVYANEHVDVDDVVRASRGARVIGVTFAEEQRRNVYFDADYAAIARSLGRAIPALPLIDFGSASADGQKILVHAGSDADAGRFYIYDRATRRLNEILMIRPQLENVQTASVRAISYPAADGTNVPAYLTMPPGGAARNLPAIVLPHGGPAARDEWGFDWLAQYLAHKGYVVLQANYRGSAGYGDEWLQHNGFQGWRTSIGDINAGARWLVSQGIADPNRMAILGWSYGGYAALQAGVTEPGLFKAIVAVAPVTDLQQAKDDFRNYTNARNVADFIGTGPHIAEGSPLRNVSRIAAPVLLFHGDRDINVPVIHSRRMDQALRDAGKSSELIVFPGLEHDLADTDARTRMLARIGTFLETALAAPH